MVNCTKEIQGFLVFLPLFHEDCVALAPRHFMTMDKQGNQVEELRSRY